MNCRPKGSEAHVGKRGCRFVTLTSRIDERYFASVQTSQTRAGDRRIREDILRDPRYPVHRIADRLLPYLQVLVEQFHPQQVILFGSYACGRPSPESDVDLIIVKELQQSPVRELAEVLKAWRTLRWQGTPLPFELILESPVDHQRRSQRFGSFYADAVGSGLRLV
jgi:uncharacterized protein